MGLLVRISISRLCPQVKDIVSFDTWGVHVVRDGDMASAAAWLAASLALAQPGITVHALCPGSKLRIKCSNCARCCWLADGSAVWTQPT
jgi:hypothetical protein